MTLIVAMLAAVSACGTAGWRGPSAALGAVETWQRYSVEFEGSSVELRVPPGGSPPEVPDRHQYASVQSRNLLDLSYGGWTADYWRKFRIVVFFWRRVQPLAPELTPENFKAEAVAIDRQWRLEMQLPEGDKSLVTEWEPRQIGGRTWFTTQVEESAFPYQTAVSPSLILVIRGTSGEKNARSLAEYRRVVEQIAAQIRVIQQ